MNEEAIGVTETVVDGILRVTIDRPARMNAVTTEAIVVVAEAFETHRDDPAVRAAVLTGTGQAFCTGADLSAIAAQSDSYPVDMLDAANRAVAAIRAFPRPVIGAVNGPAVGVGVSFALACDLTVAVESAYFMLAFTRVGLMPDGGATALVAASAGRARAMKLALLAERLPAADALAYGLVAETYRDSEFRAEVDALARRLVSGASEAYAATKTAINDATLTELEPAFTRERAGQQVLLAADDFAEGIAAFSGKREARFLTGARPSEEFR